MGYWYLPNQKLLTYIKEAYKDSNGIYGSRNIHKDLGELGFLVNKKRVARLMSEAKLYGVGTHKRKPYSKASTVHKAHFFFNAFFFALDFAFFLSAFSLLFLKPFF